MARKGVKKKASSKAGSSGKTLLQPIVEKLCAPGSGPVRSIRESMSMCEQPLPSLEAVVSIVEDLRAVLFPGYFGNAELTPDTMRFYVGSTLDRARRTLNEQVRRGLCFVCEAACHPECEKRASSMTWQFMEKLPTLRRLLAGDVRAAFEGDPAAPTPDETIFCYPGVRAITNYRLAHELYHLGVPMIPRMIAEHAHSITGIDIHPDAEIGKEFFMDHGTGIVIGETCEIGNRVRIYQGVTLGAKSFPMDDEGNPIKGIKRHPIVEDDVVIYSGATILGRVTLGKGSVIGGNVWLTRSVPPGSVITQARAREEGFKDGGGI